MPPAWSLDLNVIDEAPAPIFAGLDGADDRVVGLVGVLAGVLVGAGVAAAAVAAGAAHAQVHPAPAGLQALLAAFGRIRADVADHIDVTASGSHGQTPLLSGRASY